MAKCSAAALAVATRLMLLLWAAAGLSCSGDGGAAASGPLVLIHLSAVDPATQQAMIQVTATDAAMQVKPGAMTFAAAPFDLLGVTFPAGTRGPTTYQVSLYSDSGGCQVASGQAQLTLDRDGTFDLPVLMTAVPLCGKGATLTVAVANVLGGMGTVSSQPAGISCAGAGSSCALAVLKGTPITLTAKALRGTFGGWSGGWSGGCSGTGSCVITPDADVQVQAVFTACHGWCVEPLPFAVSANLNAVSGSGAGNVLVVGDAGTALLWNGTSWQSVPAPSGTLALRAVAGRPGGSPLYAAGDGGTILALAGTTWSKISNSGTATLRGAAFGSGGSPSAFFVGDGGSGLVLGSGATSVSSKGLGTSVALLGLAQNPGAGGNDLYIVGAVSGSTGFAESWDGNNSLTAQIVGGGATIAGNINAVVCGSAYHYAAGDGGAMVRRSSSSGNNAKWTVVGAGVSNQTLRGLWESSDSNIIAVGDAGTILQWDGTSWAKPPVVTTNNLRAVWGSSATNIYAVGDAGTVLHYLP